MLQMLLKQHVAVFDADLLQCNSKLHRQSGTAGELYDQIHKRKQIDEHDARIYAAEIVLMLKRLRQEKVSLLAFLTSRHLHLLSFVRANKPLGHHTLPMPAWTILCVA